MFALLVDLGWKSALIAGLALFANHAMRRRPPGERVAMLRAALAALLLLPVLALTAPALELAVLPALDVSPGVAATPAGYAASASGRARMAIDWPWVVYLAGAGLLVLRLGVGLVVLGRWTRVARPTRDPRWRRALDAARLRRPVRLLVSPHVAAPLSWGVVPAWVLIGPATEQRADQAEAVIAHELAHVRRFDWPVLMATKLATLLFWFNPLVWLLGRALARQTELAADGEAIRHVPRIDYAEALLALAGRPAHAAACGMSISRTALGKRICCVLDGDAARPASRVTCAALLIGSPLAAAPLAAMQFVPVVAPAAAPASVVETRPTVTSYLPAIIPPARAAAAAPASQSPRSGAGRAASTRTLRPVDVVAARPSLGRLEELAAPPSPPSPSPPPAPGTEAFAWREALAQNRRAQIEGHARAMAQRHARPEVRGDDAGQRALAGALSEAAKGLRIKAQELEAVAADGSIAREIRGAHARAAGSLRNQANRLDMEARRKLGG